MEENNTSAADVEKQEPNDNEIQPSASEEVEVHVAKQDQSENSVLETNDNANEVMEGERAQETTLTAIPEQVQVQNVTEAEPATVKSPERMTSSLSARKQSGKSPLASQRKQSARPESGAKSQALQADLTVVESPRPVFRPKMPSELPDGVKPLFLATKTQEIFSCIADNHVTEESPFKTLKKEDIVKDMFNRAAVSDFHPIKKLITDYPGDEILIGYDRDFKFGNNFVIALTEEAKEKLLRAPSPTEEGEDSSRQEKTPVPKVVYKYIPPTSKPWVSLGSENEILEEAVTVDRRPIKMSVKRQRKIFGTPCTFSDRNVSEAKDGYIECLATEDKSYSLKRLELTKGVQAIPIFIDQPSQTDWKFPRNNTTQYAPREFDEETINQINNSKTLQAFAKTVSVHFEVLLQQNEITDIMMDDYKNLGEEDDGFGSKADTHLKEYQSFTDLQFSKEKTITCIDWHPTIKGIVAVSVGEKMSFDARIDDLSKVIMTPSLVLIWSFADPIHPQLLLEAPDDILCFKFMPTDPSVIAGGCINGQVVLWDISEHVERLKAPRSGRKKATSIFPGLDDSSAIDTPIIRYCAVSSIENSHRSPISDLLWVPDHFEVTKMGIALENKTNQCVQLMTASIDHNIIFWDLRPPRVGQHQQQQDQGAKTNPYKFLDLTWKPHLKVTLFKSEPGGDHSPMKFCISERQGDKSILQEPDDEPGKHAPDTKKDAAGMGSFQINKGRDSDKKALKKLNTHLYVGTEDGELVYVDWMPQKDQDTGKLQTPKPDYYQTAHDGAIQTIQRSPFFKDVLLCVGGWNFTLWKEGISSGPILNPAANNKRLTGGFWSPTRPSIFYISRADGTIDIWDLLDRTHEPSLHQNVTPSPITCIFIQQVTSKQQLLGIGDDSGTLHILEVPWSLRQPVPNELQSMANYIDREVKRRAFVMARWDFREQEKMELEQEAKKKAGIAPNVVLTDEEIEFRMKQEYQAYLEDEQNFLRALGLKEEPLDPLPADK